MSDKFSYVILSHCTFTLPPSPYVLNCWNESFGVKKYPHDWFIPSYEDIFFNLRFRQIA